MEWGAHEKQLQALAAQGNDPKALRDKPDLEIENTLYWNAFWDLETCRPVGFGIAKIPWTAIDQWASRHGYFGEAFERLTNIIAQMDGAYIKHFIEAEKRNAKRHKKS